MGYKAQRKRPINTTRAASDQSQMQPASHIRERRSPYPSSAFAAATALLVTLKKKRWAILGYILATAIALSRLYVFVHFPSDVLVGAIVGSLIALLVCFLMKKTGFKKFLIHKNIIER